LFYESLEKPRLENFSSIGHHEHMAISVTSGAFLDLTCCPYCTLQNIKMNHL